LANSPKEAAKLAFFCPIQIVKIAVVLPLALLPSLPLGIDLANDWWDKRRTMFQD
jgi:hypothetical protein